MCETVTIIIPVYNAASTIERCIFSILGQTYKRIEIVIVNDGSKDESERIIKEICKDNSNIKYLMQENKGVSVARNQGISISSGKYIMFVDADDWIEANCVEEMVSLIEETNSDFCVSDWHSERAFVSSIDSINKEFEKSFSADIMYRNYIVSRHGSAPWGKLFKRSIIVDNNIVFHTGLPLGEDYLFVLQYLSLTNTKYCSYVNEPLYHYDCRQDGAWAKVRENYFEIQVFIEEQKCEIVTNSTKYSLIDEDLMEISKLKYYVASILYLRLIHNRFSDSYKSIKVIIGYLKKSCTISLIRKSNFSMMEKLYAFLVLSKSVIGLSLLTVLLSRARKVKRLLSSLNIRSNHL